MNRAENPVKKKKRKLFINKTSDLTVVTEKYASAFAKKINKNPNILYVNISNCYFSSVDALKKLLKPLLKNENIGYITLENLELSPVQAFLIACTIGTMKNLQSIKCINIKNMITKDYQNNLIYMLEELQPSRLILKGLGINQEVMAKLSATICKYDRLNILDVSYNPIGASAGEDIGKIIKKHAQIKGLILDHTDICDHGIVKIFDVCPKHSELLVLSLVCVGIQKDGFDKIIQFCINTPSMQYLNLKLNIAVPDYYIFSEILKDRLTCRLESLDVSHCELGNQDAENLLALAKRSLKLQSICLKGNSDINDVLLLKIKEMLHQNQQILQEKKDFKERMMCLYEIKKYCVNSAIAQLPKPILFQITANSFSNMEPSIVVDDQKAELVVNRKVPNL